MGDAKADPVRLSFNPQLRVEFHGATVTSDAGLLLPRELDGRLGLSAPIERHLTDPRTERNFQFALPDLFRQSIYSLLAGYEDTNDAEWLDPGGSVSAVGGQGRGEGDSRTGILKRPPCNLFSMGGTAASRACGGLSSIRMALQKRSRPVGPVADGAVSPAGLESHP